MATVNIFVSLDLGGNPEVVLKDEAGNSARKMDAYPNDDIKWQRQDSANNFHFTSDSLQPTGVGEAFQDPEVLGGGQTLNAKYTPPDTTPEKAYKYTLTVTDADGGKHTTTTTEAEPDDNNPVIRNRP
jgi:hypothetical protein